jgi:predicted component of type VI protein secretion system
MHKFKIGQIVQFSLSGVPLSHAASGPYEITKLLPYAGGEFEYHIKSSEEAHERIAKESQLTGL